MALVCRTSDDYDTMDAFMRGDEDERQSKHLHLASVHKALSEFLITEWHDQWEKDGTGMMATKYVQHHLDVLTP